MKQILTGFLVCMSKMKGLYWVLMAILFFCPVCHAKSPYDSAFGFELTESEKKKMDVIGANLEKVMEGIVNACFNGDKAACKTVEGYMTDIAIKGDASAQCVLGDYAFNNQEFSKAFNWYLMAAKQGHQIGQGMTGLLYEQGKGIRQDIQKALGWYDKACNNGNREACDLKKILHKRTHKKLD